jgi:two-component system NtrC family sensor kinase
MDETIRILCVDDEPNVLKALQRIFLDSNYTVLSANSAKEGFEILEHWHIQVVISDYRMPSSNGVEFLREVCKRWPDTVRIILSGYADASSIVAAINEGQVYKFVPKPWNDEELRVTVANAIERYCLFKKNAALSAELQQKNTQLAALNLELQCLLNEKSSNLEVKSRILSSYQNLLDCLPIAILGMNEDGIITSCNAKWVALTGQAMYPIGQDMREYLHESIVEFSETIRDGVTTKKARIVLNGQGGIMIGGLAKGYNGAKTKVLAFLTDEGAL